MDLGLFQAVDDYSLQHQLQTWPGSKVLTCIACSLCFVFRFKVCLSDRSCCHVALAFVVRIPMACCWTSRHSSRWARWHWWRWMGWAAKGCGSHLQLPALQFRQWWGAASTLSMELPSNPPGRRWLCHAGGQLRSECEPGSGLPQPTESKWLQHGDGIRWFLCADFHPPLRIGRNGSKPPLPCATKQRRRRTSRPPHKAPAALGGMS